MKRVLVISLSVLTLLTLSGCDMFKKKEDKKEEVKTDTKEEVKTDTKEEVKTETKENETKEEKELTLQPGMYKLNAKLNNEDLEIKFEYKPIIFEDDEVYNVILYVNDKNLTKFVVYDTEEIKEYLSSSKTKILKGKDKEYLVLLIDSGISGIPSNEIYILSKDKLLVKLYDLENMALKLTGKGIDKYQKTENGKYNKFYKIESDKIYYIVPNDLEYYDKEYTKIDLDEYVLTVNNNEVTTNKTGNTFVGTDFEGGESDFVTIKKY